jgi:hypothetical protein
MYTIAILKGKWHVWMVCIRNKWCLAIAILYVYYSHTIRFYDLPSGYLT